MRKFSAQESVIPAMPSVQAMSTEPVHTTNGLARRPRGSSVQRDQEVSSRADVVHGRGEHVRLSECRRMGPEVVTTLCDHAAAEATEYLGNVYAMVHLGDDVRSSGAAGPPTPLGA